MISTVIVAFSMFSAIPMPQTEWTNKSMRYALCAFPLIGAVIGASPKENVVRACPTPGDIIVLLGGRTGRDGCGGIASQRRDGFDVGLYAGSAGGVGTCYGENDGRCVHVFGWLAGLPGQGCGVSAKIGKPADIPVCGDRAYGRVIPPGRPAGSHALRRKVRKRRAGPSVSMAKVSVSASFSVPHHHERNPSAGGV